MKRKLFALSTIALLIGLAPASAEIVANLGVIAPGPAEAVACNQVNCVASQGTAGGSLPATGAFAHQIIFQTNVASGTITSTQILDSTKYDINDVDVQLYSLAAASPTAVGANAVLGVLLATAIGPFGIDPTANFFLAFNGLTPGQNYAIQILGADQGVLGPGASYAQQIAIVPSPVPLPAAVWLFAAACAGLAGFARIRANRKHHA